MKKSTQKAVSVIITIVMLISLFMTSAFAKDNGTKITGLQNYLKNSDNTEFDFSETSFSDNDIDWTIFALSKSGAKAYPEYNNYINSVVENTFDKLYPSDLARIALSVTAYGLDAKSIGGHDLIAALNSVDYKVQTYLSSLIFPLLALNFSDSFGISGTSEKDIINTLLAAQQSDGGFPYSTVDSGWGISSDIDTTSMTVQALSKYYSSDESIKASVDKALAYIKTQQYDDGSFGYIAYNSKSGESTAQVIIALTMLGINPAGSEYSKENGNPVSALAQFIDENTGAGLDYSSSPSTLTSYQLLMGYDANLRFDNNLNNIYTMDKSEEITTAEATEKTEETTENTTEKKAENETTAQTVDIPKTGNSGGFVFAAAVLFVGAAAVTASKKKEL